MEKALKSFLRTFPAAAPSKLVQKIPPVAIPEPNTEFGPFAFKLGHLFGYYLIL